MVQLSPIAGLSSTGVQKYPDAMFWAFQTWTVWTCAFTCIILPLAQAHDRMIPGQWTNGSWAASAIRSQSSWNRSRHLSRGRSSNLHQVLCCISHLHWKASLTVTFCFRTQLWALHKLTRCPLHMLKQPSNNAKQTRFPSFSHPFRILFHGRSRCAQHEAQHWAVPDIFNTDVITSSKKNCGCRSWKPRFGIGPNTSEMFVIEVAKVTSDLQHVCHRDHRVRS